MNRRNGKTKNHGRFNELSEARGLSRDGMQGKAGGISWSVTERGSYDSTSSGYSRNFGVSRSTR